MPSISIQLDGATLQSLDKIALATKRKRAEFISQAVKEAIRKREYEQIREAYLRRPDSATEADGWLSAEDLADSN
jgi:predicted transcriptional regulator